MPPKGSTYRVTANDASAYDESTIAKQKLAAQAVLAGRGRRNGASALPNGNGSKDMVPPADLAAQARGQGQILNDGGVSSPGYWFGCSQLDGHAKMIKSTSPCWIGCQWIAKPFTPTAQPTVSPVLLPLKTDTVRPSSHTASANNHPQWQGSEAKGG